MADPKIRPLTAEQRDELNLAVRQVEAAPVLPVAELKSNPHLHVYVAAFDGTWNDRDAVPSGERPSIVASLENKLSEQYGDRLQGEYFNGVGTRAGFVGNLVEGATGAGTIQRAEAAYDKFQAQATEWLAKDPNAEIHVHATGFSRGATSARHFLNLVDERGVGVGEGIDRLEPSGVGPNGSTKFEAVREYDSYLRQPGEVTSSAVLFDTVATGQLDQAKLAVPDSALFVAHLVSNDERRFSFPLAATMDDAQRDSLDLRNIEIRLPGAHSDVGGTYEGGVRDVSEYLSDALHHKLGLPVEAPSFDKALVDNAYSHDSRWALTKFIEDVLPTKIDERLTISVPAEPLGADSALSFEGVKGMNVTELIRELEPVQRDALLVEEHVTIAITKDDENNVGWSTNVPGRVAFDEESNAWLLDGHPALPLDGYLVEYLDRVGIYQAELAAVASLGPMGEHTVFVLNEQGDQVLAFATPVDAETGYAHEEALASKQPEAIVSEDERSHS